MRSASFVVVQTSTVGPAPEIVAPECSERRRQRHDLSRPRIQVGAVRLMKPVPKTGCHQFPVTPGETEDELGDRGDVADSIGERDLTRERRTRLGRAHRTAGNDHHRLEALGHVDPVDRRRRRRSRRHP